MDIKTNIEIKAEFSKLDIVKMISNHVAKQGYDVEKVVFKDERVHDSFGQLDGIMGVNNSRMEFAGATVYLKQREDNYL